MVSLARVRQPYPPGAHDVTGGRKRIHASTLPASKGSFGPDGGRRLVRALLPSSPEEAARSLWLDLATGSSRLVLVRYARSSEGGCSMTTTSSTSDAISR
jgi:hypothetical protein